MLRAAELEYLRNRAGLSAAEMGNQMGHKDAGTVNHLERGHIFAGRIVSLRWVQICGYKDVRYQLEGSVPSLPFGSQLKYTRYLLGMRDKYEQVVDGVCISKHQLYRHERSDCIPRDFAKRYAEFYKRPLYIMLLKQNDTWERLDISINPHNKNFKPQAVVYLDNKGNPAYTTAC